MTQIPDGQGPLREEAPSWDRPPPPVRLAVTLGCVILLLVAASWPIVAVVVFAVLTVTCAVVGVMSRDLNKKRRMRGGRFGGERLWIGMRLPWATIKASAAQAPRLLLGLGFGVLVSWLVTMLNPVDPRIAPVAGAAVMFMMSWFLGGTNAARVGARQVAKSLAPSGGYRAFWIVVLLLLVAGGGFAQFVSARAPNWVPIDEPAIFIHE